MTENKAILTNKRIEWIDISKGIAILLMVIGHVNLIPWEPYRKIIFSVHMPLFFIVAGFTSKPVITKQTVFKLVKQLLFVYLGISLITSALLWIKTGSFNPLTELLRIFWASGVPANYGPGIPITGVESIPTAGAIWFLPCLFFAKLLFCFVLKCTQKTSEWLRAVIILFLTAAGYICGQHYKIPLNIDISMFAMIFMYAGLLIKKYSLIQARLKSPCIFAMLFWFFALKYNAIELSARFYRNFPYCIVVILGAIGGCYVIFVVSEEIIKRLPIFKNFLVYCGMHSLIILCVHHLEGSYLNWNQILSHYITLWNPIYTGILIALIRVCIAVLACFLYQTAKTAITGRQKKNHSHI